MNVALYLNDHKSVDVFPVSMIICDLNAISLYHDYFHLEGIGHAMKASRELGSAPIYDSYSPTYNPSHGPQERERDAPRTPVTLHLSTSSSGTGKPIHRISSKRI